MLDTYYRCTPLREFVAVPICEKRVEKSHSPHCTSTCPIYMNALAGRLEPATQLLSSGQASTLRLSVPFRHGTYASELYRALLLRGLEGDYATSNELVFMIAQQHPALTMRRARSTVRRTLRRIHDGRIHPEHQLNEAHEEHETMQLLAYSITQRAPQ